MVRLTKVESQSIVVRGELQGRREERGTIHLAILRLGYPSR
jgi:hypothetical protein